MDETQMRRHWLGGMARTFTGMKREEVMTMYSDTMHGSLQGVMHHDVIERLQKPRSEGAKVILVSGIFADFVQIIAEHIGMDGAIGTNIEFRDGIATGKLIGIPSVGAQKIGLIQQYLRENHPQTKPEDCYAYADSYSDRAMLSTVGHGVAAHPDKKMREAALERIPFGRFGQPEDVARVVLFLASPLSYYVTGQEINVSGGLQIP
jgi:HAD superfamily hydrolase (TIGR01490 family)